MKDFPGLPALEALHLPEDLIVSGRPVARTATLHSTPDNRTTVGFNTCTPGTFRYDIEADELTHVLAGRVIVEPQEKGGERIEAEAGDSFFLPAGTNVIVDVQEEVADLYVIWSAD